MGLDVYVGTFRRYYAGQWETIIQQSARQSGMQVQVMRPFGQPSGILGRLRSWLLPKRDMMKGFERWRSDLSAVAGVPLDWNEHPEAEYFTDKPGWDGYGALLLWTAYDEHGADRPATAEDWEKDPILQAAFGDSPSKYRHLLKGTQIWLPGTFADPFEAKTLLGDEAVYGSTQRLASELAALNDSTWRAGESDISQWRHEAPDLGVPLEESARFGFAVLYELANLAVQHRLPMKLDY